MNKPKIAIYPRTISARLHCGYSFGWYRKESSSGTVEKK